MPYPESFQVSWPYTPTSTTVPQQPSQSMPQLPRYQVARVKGEQGANDFPMGPNSSIFLADETEKDRLWLCTTDELGFKKVRPIICHFPEEDNSMDDFSKRLKRLEDIVNERIVNSRSSKSKSATTDSES